MGCRGRRIGWRVGALNGRRGGLLDARQGGLQPFRHAQDPELDALLAIAIDHAQVDLAHKYVDFVFYEGLDPAQQGLLRALARGGPIDRALLRPRTAGRG